MRSSASNFARTLPAIVLAAVAIASVALGPESVGPYGEIVFLASIVLLGLPHGAVDHIIMARLAHADVVSRQTATLVAIYLVLVGLTLAAWVASPMWVFAGFILLTWFHWGQGDAWYLEEKLGTPGWWREVVVRGALPMLVPMFGSAAEYADVAGQFISAAGGQVGDLTPGIESVRVYLAAAAAPLALWGIVAAARRQRWWSIAELLGLVVYFLLVPPLLAIALYFCFWHSTRHIERLAEWTSSSIPRVLLLATPLTFVSIGMLAALLAVVEGDPFPIYLALIAALTVPHVVVVTTMDARERTQNYA